MISLQVMISVVHHETYDLKPEVAFPLEPKRPLVHIYMIDFNNENNENH